MVRVLIVGGALGLVAALGACGGGAGERATKRCENGIVVYADVACSVVTLDMDDLPDTIAVDVDRLQSEARSDSSKALANAQEIQRVLATHPSEVCTAMQTSPDGEFVKTDNIAPIVAELAESTCPLGLTE